MLTETEVKGIKPLRYLRKVSDGRGLYLLVTPKGGRWWRYAYRFAQKYKSLALGTYPAVSLERARSRHEFARNLLAHRLDPSALKAALGKDLFVVTMREWEIARHMSGPAFQSRVKSRRPHPVTAAIARKSSIRLETRIGQQPAQKPSTTAQYWEANSGHSRDAGLIAQARVAGTRTHLPTRN